MGPVVGGEGVGLCGSTQLCLTLIYSHHAMFSSSPSHGACVQMVQSIHVQVYHTLPFLGSHPAPKHAGFTQISISESPAIDGHSLSNS